MSRVRYFLQTKHETNQRSGSSSRERIGFWRPSWILLKKQKTNKKKNLSRGFRVRAETKCGSIVGGDLMTMIHSGLKPGHYDLLATI